MSKFKIIEESRFLKNEEMTTLKGGDCSPVNFCGNTPAQYTHCPNPHFNITPCYSFLICSDVIVYSCNSDIFGPCDKGTSYEIKF